MSRYYFESPSFGARPTGDNADVDVDFTLTLDDEDNLPYPLPLQRDAFLSESFSPQDYLSSLNVRTRHQTLEDLRTELRTRSQDLSKELLDLVNSNYQDFLGLGSSLKGGEEKVEEVRVGLLGFQRGVAEIRQVVEERRLQVETLLAERKKLWRERQLAQGLLDMERRMAELEGRLLVASAGKHGSNGKLQAGAQQQDGPEEEEQEADEDEDDDEGESDEEQDGVGISVGRLRRHVGLYQCLQEVIERVGVEHPFVKAQESRMMKIRNTLLLDLNAALKEAKTAGAGEEDRVVKVLSLYREVDEAPAAVALLQK